ncbi:MAG TPA: AraC family transcriptional regulator [Vicinamibacterales bacterium]|nr:AraC family transcriptional regulator [Vicinamibacterales bacterium]
MSDWSESLRELPGGASIWSRGRQKTLPGGLWWIEQHVRCRGRQEGPFAIGAGWIIEFIELKRGRFGFRRDGGRLELPWRRLVWVLPAFSVVHLDSSDVEFRFVAIAGENRPQKGLGALDTAGSRVFPLRGRLPADAGELLRSLDSLTGGVSVEISTAFPQLVCRAKRWIEEKYREPASMTALARSLGVSPAHLSREFRRAVGMSPLKYLHHLRSSEALGRLAAGDSVVDASLDVGYGDLSAFYKQFRRLGCSTPGRYRAR